MTSVGYAWLQDSLQLSPFPVRQPASIQPVTRIKRIGETLAVPCSAPRPDDPLVHVLFALKHEGVNLAILAQALPQIPAAASKQSYTQPPMESTSGKPVICAKPSPVGSCSSIRQYAVLSSLDSTQNLYVTMPGERNWRWRAEFNGIGIIASCVTVKRVP
jgi:hypothetical protein